MAASMSRQPTASRRCGKQWRPLAEPYSKCKASRLSGLKFQIKFGTGIARSEGTAMLFNCASVKVAIFVLIAAPIQAQSSNPLSDDVRRAYADVRNNILKSAEKMPAENYDFRPAPRVRTFAQLMGHVAQEQYLFFCGPVKGEQKAADIERTKATKLEILAALKDSFAYCDAAYNEVTDASA